MKHYMIKDLGAPFRVVFSMQEVNE